MIQFNNKFDMAFCGGQVVDYDYVGDNYVQTKVLMLTGLSPLLITL